MVGGGGNSPTDVSIGLDEDMANSSTAQAAHHSSPGEGVQLSLPIDAAPPKVRAHGYRDAHVRPLVSAGKGRDGRFGGAFRVAPADAWRFPSIELRTGNSWPVLILDCDETEDRSGTEAVIAALVDRRIPPPNWMVTRVPAGGTHVVYCLSRPVHRGAAARERPLLALARASEFFGQVLEADRAYTAVLTHNPMARAQGRDLRTTWGRREPYELGELARVIPFGWRRPRPSRTDVGRNCDLFWGLMRWAGSEANLGYDVLAAAVAANQQFEVPLELPEVQGIARSVERYRARWIAQGRFYEVEERSAWGRARGHRSGEARRRERAARDAGLVQAVVQGGETFAAVALRLGVHEHTVRHVVCRDAPLFGGRPSLRERRPWEDEGLSRATWYRRRGTKPARTTQIVPRRAVGGS